MADGYIIKRKGKFLTERYKWSQIPYIFPDWQVFGIFQTAINWKDRPTHYCRVSMYEMCDMETLVWSEL